MIQDYLKIPNLHLVVVCIISIYLLRVQNSVRLTPFWRSSIDRTTETGQKWPLSQPIVTDLESDGVTDIVTMTIDGYLNVMEAPMYKQKKTAIPWLDLIRKVKVADTNQSYVVTIDTGYIEPLTNISTIRTQIIIVVLSNWTVLCYDHTLDLLWRNNLRSDWQPREGYELKSFTVLISSRQLSQRDKGLVIIGGGFGLSDHSFKRRKKVRTSQSPPSSTFQTAHLVQDPYAHYSCYCFSGNDGAPRWHHTADDHNDSQENKENFLHKNHRIKRSDFFVEETHWKQYKDAVIKLLPHSWSQQSDTHMELARLAKPKHDNAKHILAERAGASAFTKAPPSHLLNVHARHLPGLVYGGLHPHSRHEHVSGVANSVAVFNHNGVEILDLLTGRPLTRLPARDRAAVYADVDNDGRVERVVYRAGRGEGSVRPAFEAQRTPLFRVPTHRPPTLWGWVWWPRYEPPQLHPDLQKTVPPLAVHSKGIKPGVLSYLLGKNLPYFRQNKYDSIFLTETGILSSYGEKGEFHWMVQTSASWHHITMNMRKGSAVSSEMNHTYENLFHPSLTSFSSIIYGAIDLVIVIGWDEFAIVDLSNGRQLASHSLPCQPTAKPVLSDMNNDGWTDLIIVCPKSYIGFLMEPQTHYWQMLFLSATIVALVCLFAWCFTDQFDSDDQLEPEF